MQFGEDKCAYLQIEKGKVLQNIKPTSINDLTIKPIEEGDNYQYLGIDENISYNGPMNKERVTKEYINRIRKIWNSRILDWTCKEIDQIGIKTRKPSQCQVVFIPTTMLIGYTSTEKMRKRYQSYKNNVRK